MKMLLKKYLPILLIKILKYFYLNGTAFVKELQHKPASTLFGFDRGTPVDRFYIELFLKNNSALITGDVLEIAENTYTLKFAYNLKKSHILHVVAGNPEATLVGNLETGENIPENQFDCLIVTQTLAFIYDVKKVIKNCYRALKPGGVLLLTNPCISPVSMYDMERWGDFWRFTPLSIKRLLEENFFSDKIEVFSYGNYYAAQAFLSGKVVEELSIKKLLRNNDMYPVMIAAVAVKKVE